MVSCYTFQFVKLFGCLMCLGLTIHLPVIYKPITEVCILLEPDAGRIIGRWIIFT